MVYTQVFIDRLLREAGKDKIGCGFIPMGDGKIALYQTFGKRLIAHLRVGEDRPVYHTSDPGFIDAFEEMLAKKFAARGNG
jgi:hypothetical protein